MKKENRQVIRRSLKYIYKSGPHGTAGGKQSQKHMGSSSSLLSPPSLSFPSLPLLSSSFASVTLPSSLSDVGVRSRCCHRQVSRLWTQNASFFVITGTVFVFPLKLPACSCTRQTEHAKGWVTSLH